MPTEVSGRIVGRSVFEPFSAHRRPTRLKVGANRLPTASERKRERLQEEPEHDLGDRDMGEMSRSSTIPRGRPGRGGAPGHHHHKGGERGLDRPRPQPLSRGRSR